MSARSFKLNLNQESSENLKAIADSLGITETEVIRKGLLLMGLYEKLKRTDGGAFMIKEGEKEKELLIV